MPPPPTTSTSAAPQVAQPKKKTVTFKNILETSDDLTAVKRVYNPQRVPAMPIIKISKNFAALSRSERFARGDIVMPSRLTEVLRNYSANHIDKLNLLTFKSLVADGGDETTACGDDGAEAAADESQRADSKSPTDSVTSGDAEDATAAPVTMTATVAAEATIETTANNGASTVNAGGEKKFVLPHRSVHSSREIFPNKRYLEQGGASKSSGRRSGKKPGSSSSRSQTADNADINTLSSQIDNSKMLDEDDDEDEKSSRAVVKADTATESESRSESEDNTTGRFLEQTKLNRCFVSLVFNALHTSCNYYVHRLITLTIILFPLPHFNPQKQPLINPIKSSPSSERNSTHSPPAATKHQAATARPRYSDRQAHSLAASPCSCCPPPPS